MPHEITIAVAYVDEDLMELEVVVGAGYWCGRASAYTVPQDMATFAVAIQHFADGASAEAEFVAGADTGIGLIGLRFYRVDRAGHIACHVRLATGRLSTKHRPEEVFRLSIEVQAEVGHASVGPTAWRDGSNTSWPGVVADLGRRRTRRCTGPGPPSWFRAALRRSAAPASELGRSAAVDP